MILLRQGKKTTKMKRTKVQFLAENKWQAKEHARGDLVVLTLSPDQM